MAGGDGRKYGFFLFALFVIASGLAFLETGANPFIAQLGTSQSSERRLNFSQAFNPLGAITGVLIGTVFIFSGIELKPAEIQAMKVAGQYDTYLRHETMRVLAPYLVLGCVVFICAPLMMRTKFPSTASGRSAATADATGRFRNLLGYPHFLGAVVAQFFYVGGASRNLELFHPICAGLYAFVREVRRIFLDRDPGRFRRGKVLSHLPDEICASASLDGSVQSGEYRLGRHRRGLSRLGGALVSLFDQLLHVIDVPHNLCPGD